MLESAVEGRAKRWADEHGILNVKFTPAGQVAYMDRLFFVPGGKPILIEFKRPGEEPRPLQAYRIKKLRELGYDVRCTDDADEAIMWLKERTRHK